MQPPMTMQPRLNPFAIAPDAIATMREMENYLQSCGLEHGLALLVKMRASQINGCAFRLHMHSKDARVWRCVASVRRSA